MDVLEPFWRDDELGYGRDDMFLYFGLLAWNAFPCPLCLSGGGGTAVQASQKLCCCFGNEAKPTESDGLEVGVEADFVLRWLHQSFTCIGR